MGRAITMENDIEALKIKVKRLENTVRGMVSKLDSLDEKSSKTVKVDLIEDVGASTDDIKGEKNEKEKTNDKGITKSNRQSNSSSSKSRKKSK